ncbi:aldo/keto reductase [Ktedonospora formicarum]|uniref:Aldo/keto reductase n=1 Tax=Ktedonospora formicarum TaxID=2778364 RepID=A0A8J3I0S9_9CHLR|nr:aldo/keto reductase [Ktedonospora formicarum]GHO47219.1 aldo/keto reductase [Ktedonospora formicarum]
MSQGMTRTLGRSGIKVNALGMGCWAIGGQDGGNLPSGYGPVDDVESIRAIHRALELGVTFFDTAAVYGCGHSEHILGQALGKQRQNVTIATKFGAQFNEATRIVTGGFECSPTYIRQACEASLRRLQTDYIDLYQFHENHYDLEHAFEVREILEQLVAEGKIRFYGWSTDDPERARLFALGPHCTAIQHTLNIFADTPDMLAICEEYHLASINRGPLAMGLLSGKYTSRDQIGQQDIRFSQLPWNPFNNERLPGLLRKLEKVRRILTDDGRTLAQGALAWIWARSEHTVPIPGFKTVAQVEENVGAMRFGPLSPTQVDLIEALLNRADE